MSAALLTFTAILASSASGASSPNSSRIVTLGASVTELVYALDAGDRLVGADATSLYPAQTKDVRTLGYYRQVSSEGVLSLRPTMVLALEGSGPPEALAAISRAGVNVITVPEGHGDEELREKFRVVGDALGAPERALALADQALERVNALKAPAKKPRVLFIYARGRGALSVSGRDTSADTIVNWAGGQNAVTDYEGYRPLTAEAVVAAAPEVILVTTRGLESLGGLDGVLRAPGVALTPAGRARRIVAIDDLELLSFGPRLGAGVERLHRELHRDGSG